MLGVDEFVEMPTFGAEVATADGVVFTWVGTHNQVLLNTKVYAAATAAVIADGHDVLHGNCFSRYLYPLVGC